jgi:SAM-dependent methyltransferase
MVNPADGLPPIETLSAVPLHRWMAIGERLRNIRMNDAFVDRLSANSARNWAANPVLVWQARRRAEPAAYAYRMLALHDPVTEPEAAEAIGAEMLAELLSASVLVRNDFGRIVSLFDLKIFNGLLVFCDQLFGGPDAVFGVGPGSAAICRAVPRKVPARNAVDIGCGAGAVALSLAKSAQHVVATDINPRAIAMVEINAALNGVTNLDARVGDLIEPVRGMVFDLITAQLPFIPDPGVAEPSVYRFAGTFGDELLRRLLPQLSSHLSSEGCVIGASLVPIRHDTPPADAFRAVASGETGSLSSLVFIGADIDADSFSLQYGTMELRPDDASTDAAITRMRDHMHRNGIYGVCPAVWRMQHADSSDAWTEIVQVNATLWESISTTDVERMHAAIALLHSGAPAVLAAKLRVPKEALLFEQYTCGPDRTIYLALPAHRLVRPIPLSEAEWALIAAVDAGSDVATTLASCHDPQSAGGDSDGDLAVISRLLRAGLLEIEPCGN